jgi:hypothetical protein
MFLWRDDRVDHIDLFLNTESALPTQPRVPLSHGVFLFRAFLELTCL